MSPTKQISHDSQVFNFDSKLAVRAMRIMLTAAIVLGLAYPALADPVSIYWRGTTGTGGTKYWSNNNSWNLTGPSPAATNPGSPNGNIIIFTNDGNQAYPPPSPPINTNIVDHSITANSMIYAQTIGNHLTEVDPSILMKISGSAVPTSTSLATWSTSGTPDPLLGIDGSVSLWACSLSAGANDISQYQFVGGGQMDVSSSTGGTTGGDIVVRQANGTAGSHSSILDLSGLSSFNANVDQLLISYAATSTPTVADRPNGTMYLAQTNTITLNNTGTIVASGSGFGAVDGGLILGFAGSHSTGQASYLYLGQTNTINVQNVYIAGRRQTAGMVFNPIYSSTSPTLKMRGINGTSRVTQISIGDNTGNGTGSTNIADGNMDLTGGIADIQVSTLVMGTSSVNSTGNSSYGGRGALTFTGGTIDATSIILGNMTADLNTNRGGDQGTLNANGTANLVAGSIILGKGPVSGIVNGTSTGTLNIRGTATVTLSGNILAGGINSILNTNPVGSFSTIMMSGGTLNMQNHYIGYDGATITPITNLNLSGGSITNLTGVYAITARVTSNYSLTSGPLTIVNTGYGTCGVDMRNSAVNTFTVSNLTLPTGAYIYSEFSSSGSGNDQVAATDLYLNSGDDYISVSPLGASFALGTYHVITYTNEHNTGGSVTWHTKNTTRSVISDPVDTGSGNINITILSAVSGNNLTWAGTAGATAIWDWNSSPNWTSGSPPAADHYYDLDAVNFTGGVSGTATTVNINNTISGAVAGFYPSSVTVNSDYDYVIAANNSNAVNRISGTTTLTKSGSGTLTINTSNDYSGTTTISGGTIKLGNDGALGSSSLVINGGTSLAYGGTLDINHHIVGGRSITVSGVGAGGLGAIVNNSTSTYSSTITDRSNDVPNITLSGDTTFGGTCSTSTYNSGLPKSTAGRWEMDNTNISTNHNPYNLTKVGNNLIVLINSNVDTALADINLKGGILRLEGATNLGNPAGTVTVDGTGIGQTGNNTDSGLSGTVLQLNNLTTPLDKIISLKNNGALFVMQNPADSAGGDTVVGQIAIDSTGGIINAGGVLQDIASNSNTPNAKMYLNGAITGSSGAVLTKLGPGSITLGGSSSFAGTINHKDGNLIVNGYLQGSVTMFKSATSGITTTLTGTGTVGAAGSSATVTNASNTIIAPGATAATGDVGTMTMNNLTLNDGGQINYDLATTNGSDLINLVGSGGAGGNLTLNGTTNINIPNLSTLASNPAYRLMNVDGTISGTTDQLNLLNYPQHTRRTFSITFNTGTSPKQVNLSVIGTNGNLTWVGDGSSNSWDVFNSGNKIWSGSEPFNYFYNFDDVHFTDASSYNTVNIAPDSGNGNVTPSTITVTNNTKNYTFSGFKITGITGLSKDGTGTLILDNAGNDFSGAITITNGILQVGDGPSGNYGSLGTGAMSNNGQLLFYQNGSISTTLANAISGTGSLEQRGTNTLTVSGSNSYSGITTISNGTLQAGSSTALGSTVGGTTILSGATLDINNRNLGAEPVTVQGAGVNGAGAIVNNDTDSSTTPLNALRFITMLDDTTIGGSAPPGASNANYPGAPNSGRWDMTGSTATLAQVSTGGNPYKLTKVGNNQISFVGVQVDSNLGDVDIKQGILNLQQGTNGLGDTVSHKVTVESGGILNFYSFAAAFNKPIHLQGGMLYAQSNSLAGDNTIGGPVYVKNDTSGQGSVINTGGSRDDIANYSASSYTGVVMTISGAIQNDTGGGSSDTLTKLGPGTAYLNGANTFNGTLNLNDGITVINNSWAGPITMVSSSSPVHTTLSGTGTISGMVIDNYQTNIAPGATANTGSVGVLTLTGGLTLGLNGSGTITLDLSNDPDISRSKGINDLINVTGGGLSLNSTTNVNINIVGGYLQGSSSGTHYQLIHYNSISESSPSWGLPLIDSRQGYNVVKNPATNSIDLVVTGNVGNLTWLGGTNSNTWDTKSTANWNNPGPPAVNPDVFYITDMVTFDNSSANTSVNIVSGGVSPGTVTVNNDTSHNYTFAGGPITGGTTLTKSGSGSLSLNSSNSYTGATAISGGKIILGDDNALGSSTAALTIADGATLDLNVHQLYAKPITVQGAGVGNKGAIVNNNTANAPLLAQYDVSNVTLSYNTTIGGTSTTVTANSGLPGSPVIGRWALRAQSGSTATLSTSGNSYILTKVGNNQIMLVSANVDTALGSVNVNEGVLSLEGTTTLGNAGTVTVDGTALGQNSGGSILQMNTLTTALTKNVTLQHGGQLYALLNTASTDNTVSGTVSLGSGGGQFNAGGARDDYAANPLAIMTVSGNIGGGGGLTCPGPGTVFITSPTVNYSGNTTVNSGTLQINSIAGSTVALHAVSGSGTLGIGDGTAMPSVTADSVSVGTLTIGAGATLTIKAIPGGPTAGSAGISPVPEPATWAMLMLAAMGLGIYWRRSR